MRWMARALSAVVIILMGLLLAAPAPAQLNPKETAVLFVDFQNEFAAETGSLYPIVKNEIARKNVLANAVELVRKAREMGVLIIHTTSEHLPGYQDFDLTNPGLFHRIVMARKAFRPGTPGVEIYQPIRPGSQDPDLVLKGRTSMSGFAGTDLDRVLRILGIKKLGIAGFVTNICVESTARDAYNLGYHLYFLNDVMAAKSIEDQTFTEKNNFPYIGKNTTFREFLGMVRPVAARTP